MGHFKPYTRVIADPPSWMDAEEREHREAVMHEVVGMMRQRGGMPAPAAELLASYVEGSLDDAELLLEVDKAYLTLCH